MSGFTAAIIGIFCLFLYIIGVMLKGLGMGIRAIGQAAAHTIGFLMLILMGVAAFYLLFTEFTRLFSGDTLIIVRAVFYMLLIGFGVFAFIRWIGRWLYAFVLMVVNGVCGFFGKYFIKAGEALDRACEHFLNKYGRSV